MQTQSDFGTGPSPLILDFLVLISQRRFVSCVQFLQDGRQVGLKLFLKLDACWYTRPNHTVPATPEWRKQAGVESRSQNAVFDRIKLKNIFLSLLSGIFFENVTIVWNGIFTCFEPNRLMDPHYVRLSLQRPIVHQLANVCFWMKNYLKELLSHWSQA